MKIAVIGGGAAGMMAAITAREYGAEVTIYEHMPRLGKKILLTGSGKCNISNEDTDLIHYHSTDENLTLVKNVFSHVSPQNMLDKLNELGLIYKSKRGYIYPYSEQASSVLDVLRFAVRDKDINVFTETDIKELVVKEGLKPAIRISDNSTYSFDKIIIATGSCAYKKTGSDGSGYELSRKIGHKIIKPISALTYLECEENFFASVAGIRTAAKVTLEGKSETGELQLTKTGISGINVFNLSYLAAKSLDKGKKVSAVIDFWPDIESDDLNSLLISRCRNNKSKTLEELFTGIFHKNLGLLIIKESGICRKHNDLIYELSKEEIGKISHKIKNFEVTVKGCGGFDNSQVICGGIDTLQINEQLESKLNTGVFFAGEIIDVNGDCGGYNLTFAFASGMYAAMCAVGKNDKN